MKYYEAKFKDKKLYCTKANRDFLHHINNYINSKEFVKKIDERIAKQGWKWTIGDATID